MYHSDADQMEPLNFNTLSGNSAHSKKDLEAAYKDILAQIRQCVLIQQPVSLDVGPFGVLETKMKPLVFRSVFHSFCIQYLFIHSCIVSLQTPSQGSRIQARQE